MSKVNSRGKVLLYFVELSQIPPYNVSVTIKTITKKAELGLIQSQTSDGFKYDTVPASGTRHDSHVMQVKPKILQHKVMN